MELKESITKTKTGYIVKTEVETSEASLKQHLEGIKKLKVDYESDIKRLSETKELSEDLKKLKDNMDKIDDYRALEVQKSKIGNIEKHVRELKSAIKAITQQIKNREGQFKDVKEPKPSK